MELEDDENDAKSLPLMLLSIDVVQKVNGILDDAITDLWTRTYQNTIAYYLLYNLHV